MSLGGFSANMDIIRYVELRWVLTTFPDHNRNEIYIEISPTNNNIFFVGVIDFNARYFNLRSGKFVQNRVVHESDTNSVLFLPVVMPLEPDQMTPTLCLLIQYSMRR